MKMLNYQENNDLTYGSCYLHTLEDALLILQAVLDGELPMVYNRPNRTSQASLIQSGNVFVFDTNQGSIGRWTDGANWSYSRVIEGFLIYRELTMRKKNAIVTEYENLIDGECAGYEDEYYDYNDLCGTLVGNNVYKKGGFIKKTFSITYETHKFRIVSYYLPEDVKSGKLQIPSTIPEFSDVYLNCHFAKYLKLKAPSTNFPRESRISCERFIYGAKKKPFSRMKKASTNQATVKNRSSKKPRSGCTNSQVHTSDPVMKQVAMGSFYPSSITSNELVSTLKSQPDPNLALNMDLANSMYPLNPCSPSIGSYQMLVSSPQMMSELSGILSEEMFSPQSPLVPNSPGTGTYQLPPTTVETQLDSELFSGMWSLSSLYSPDSAYLNTKASQPSIWQTMADEYPADYITIPQNMAVESKRENSQGYNIPGRYSGFSYEDLNLYGIVQEKNDHACNTPYLLKNMYSWV